MTYAAQLVADYFLAHNSQSLTAMQIIKLAYIAHGYTLAFTKKPLIKARIEAWKYGPVIPVLYDTFKGYGGSVVDSLTYCGTGLGSPEIGIRKKLITDLIDEGTRDLLDQVLDGYGGMDGMQLSALTHEKGTPWDQCYVPNELFTPIPNHIIQEFYERKVKYGESGH